MKQKEFMPPLVQTGGLNVVKVLKSSFEIIIHGILPHQSAKEPNKVFEAKHIADQDIDTLLSVSEKFYDEATKRIETLEEKAFKLLTYISAVSALLVYFLSTDTTGLYRVTVIVALTFLAIAILISLRCIGIKSQQALYIDALFKFNNDETTGPVNKNKKEIICSLINSAVFNHNVADNTADILKAARIMLSVGIIGTAISCAFYLGTKEKPKEPTKMIMQFSDTAIRSWQQPLNNIERALKNLSVPVHSAILDTTGQAKNGGSQ